MRRNKPEAAGVPTSRDLPPATPSAYRSNDEVLHAARQMFKWRGLCWQIAETADPDLGDPEVARRAARGWANAWHRSLAITTGPVALARRMRDARLNRFEREALAALVLNQLGLAQPSISNPGDLLRFMVVTGFESLSALRALSETGRLHRSGLLFYSNEDEDLRDRAIFPDPALVEAVLQDHGRVRKGWPVKSEIEFFSYFSRLTRALRNKATAVEGLEAGYNDLQDYHKAGRLVDKLMTGFEETLGLHPAWGISRFFADLGAVMPWEPLMLAALIGKEQGHIPPDDDLFKGLGLARVAAPNPYRITHVLESLRPDKPLLAEDWIRPAAGSSELLDADSKSISETEFELSDKAINAMGLKKQILRSRNQRSTVREPVVSLSQLVLGEKVRKALDMAAAQAKNARVLTDDWGLAEVIPYGRTVTLLFSGPPGTGKTACAEGLAKELGKPILVADYAQIQNCFVGQTEKNIARTFREAKYSDALLFWDEADAMFYDRDAASRTWEVRDVNVLLTELERFEGVVVLATNRKITLDKALERRISLKVEFDRPDKDMRRSIWGKLMPSKLPLAPDVDLDELSRLELSGGEIKNAVINAARFALLRGPKGPVTMADFNEALRFERDGGWGSEKGEKIGFCNLPVAGD